MSENIVSKPPSKAYDEGWERTFGKKKERGDVADEEDCAHCPFECKGYKCDSPPRPGPVVGEDAGGPGK
jgi:hypothetical protein